MKKFMEYLEAGKSKKLYNELVDIMLEIYIDNKNSNLDYEFRQMAAGYIISDENEDEEDISRTWNWIDNANIEDLIPEMVSHMTDAEIKQEIKIHEKYMDENPKEFE